MALLGHGRLAVVVMALLGQGCLAVVVMALLVGGCRDRATAVSAARRDGRAATDRVASTTAGTPAAPLFPSEVRSLKLTKSSAVYPRPSRESRPRGTVASGTRVSWRRAQAGPGCEQEHRWIEILPGAWVCEAVLEPSPLPPRGVELPRLKPRELVPGTYAVIRTPAGEEGHPVGYRTPEAITREVTEPTGAAWKCRLEGAAFTSGKHSYWRTDCGLIFESKYVRPLSPSRYQGVWLVDVGLTLPAAFTDLSKVSLYNAPSGGAKVRTLPGRTLLKVHEVKVVADRGEGRVPRRAYRVGPGEWLSSVDANLITAVPPPPGLRPGERWVDVDTTEQVLVAYEGPRPVFVTLVSTGREKVPRGQEPTPTDLGVYRIGTKFAEIKMAGLPGTDEAYYVSKVPWTQYFHGDLALHGVYWHDRFGHQASHGCVNLAPQDARMLYFWTDPPVPLGWTMRTGDEEQPGSLVRVRSYGTPQPPFKGYAAQVHQRRRGHPGAQLRGPAGATGARATLAGPDGSGRGTASGSR